MRVHRGILPDIDAFRSVAIGNFDGVHLGHQELLRQCSSLARTHGLSACAVTFEPHPKEFFSPKESVLARVNNRLDKVLDIASCGIDEVFIMNFNRALADMGADEFVEKILCHTLHAKWVSVGEDFHFGKKGSAGVSELRELCAAFDIQVVATPTILVDGIKVSSTSLRHALAVGNMEAARDLLGVRFHITGQIIHGAALGRRLGYPTINMDALPTDAQGVPALRGVYAVYVHGLSDAPLKGVASITTKPTLGLEKKFLLETNIFDYSDDCYGRYARIEFVSKLRDDKRFSNIEELKAAISLDAMRAARILSGPGCEPTLTNREIAAGSIIFV